MNKIIKLIFTCLIVISTQVGSQSSEVYPSILIEKPVDNHLLKLVTVISERAHINQKKINNESSIEILETFIETLDSCCTEDNPKRYPDAILAEDYLQERLKEIKLIS